MDPFEMVIDHDIPDVMPVFTGFYPEDVRNSLLFKRFRSGPCGKGRGSKVFSAKMLPGSLVKA